MNGGEFLEKFEPFRPDSEGWHLHGSELQFHSPFMNVHQERILVPSKREPLDWTVVRRKFAVVVAPITAEGKFILVRQERIPVRKTLWEFPAGQVDEGEANLEVLLETVRRELKEETGYEPTSGAGISSLGYYFSSQGFTDEHAYLFVVNPVVAAGEATPEHSESILGAAAFTPTELRAMIASNEIRDANTLAMFARMIATDSFPE